MVYNIIEIANTHGGNAEYMDALLDEFSAYGERYGIKFQASKPDCIATPDYEYYEVYKELFFNNKQWKGFITKAAKTKDVWLDLFDLYSIEILEENFDQIFGLKLQASVLNNLEVVGALSGLNLQSKELIINISGYTIRQIRTLIEDLSLKLNPKELLLEIGFQAYPTRLADSGFSKIEAIKSTFPNRLVFADHIDAEDPTAKYFPVIASLHGVDVIEKHVRLDRETRYDHFSSLKPKDYSDYITLLHAFSDLKQQPFINSRETEYLRSSLMKPQLAADFQKGSLLNLEENLVFRRSGRDGLDVFDLKQFITDHYILSRDREKGETLTRHDFKKAHIGVIIACRLKSTRLETKALEKIGDLTSIEYCIRNCLRFPYVSSTVLATSHLESDSELENYTYTDSVHFHRGDPDDVIARYLDVIDKLKIDVFVRVTGDNPFVDADICKFLIDKHFETGADYTTAKQAAVGTNLEIINSSALRKVKKHFPQAEYSEYMSWYFTNNPGHFRINLADLPETYVRNYRLTLDYPEDLELYNKIHHRLALVKSDFNLLDIFDLLDNSDLAGINGSIGQKYQTDQALIDTLNEKTRIPEAAGR